MISLVTLFNRKHHFFSKTRQIDHFRHFSESIRSQILNVESDTFGDFGELQSLKCMQNENVSFLSLIADWIIFHDQLVSCRHCHAIFRNQTT